MTAGQSLDREAEFAQSFLREVDLPMFKGIFVAATQQERELIAISLEEVAEIEPIALRFLISHEPRCCGEVEQAIVATHSPAGPVGKAAQHRRGVPRVGEPVCKEPAIEDQNAAYVRSTRGFAPL